MQSHNQNKQAKMSFQQQQQYNNDQREVQGYQRQPIILPPMYFPLEKIPSSEMPGNFKRLTAIGCFPTEDAKAEANAFLDHVSKFHPNFIWTFGYIPAPPDSNITRRVIGKNGYYFKMTTTLTEVNFIWHNRVRNVFLFWGSSSFKVINAMNRIRWRIHKCYLDARSMKSEYRHHDHTPKPNNTGKQIYYDIEDISDDEDDETNTKNKQGLISQGHMPDTERSIMNE